MAGQKLKKQGWAKAENISGDHILTGGLRPPFMVRPPSAAAPCGDSICGLRLYLQLLPSLGFSSFAQPRFFSFCPAMYFQLSPSHVFSAFAQISISGQLGAKNLCIFSFPVPSIRHFECLFSIMSCHFRQVVANSKQIEGTF